MRHRLTVLLIGTALAVLSGTAAAHGSVGLGISIGIPGPVYVAPPPVYYSAPPVYYASPVYYGPSAYYGPPAYYRSASWGFKARGDGGHHRGGRGHR